MANILTEAEGSRGADLHRGVEDPDTFTLILEWDSVEALTQKPEFGGSAEAVGPYLAGQSEVRHVETVA